MKMQRSGFIRRLTTLGAVAIAASTVLAACGSGAGGGGGGAAAGSGGKEQDPSTVSIAIGGANSFANLPSYIAQSQQFLTDALKPLHVTPEFVDFSDSTSALKSLLAGQTQYMAGQTSTMLNAVASGQAIQALAQFYDTDIDLMIARKGLPTTVPQLAGHTWGITAFGTTNEVSALSVASKYGVAKSQVKLVAVGPPAAYEPAITSKKVDVIFAGEPGAENLIASGEGSLVLNLFDPAAVQQVYGGPYASSLLMGTSAYAKAHPALTKAVVTAHVKALQWLQQHLSDPATIAAALPKAMRTTNITAVLKRITPGLSKDGMVLPESFTNTIKASEATGFIEGHPNFDLRSIVNNDER
ncbi:MAG TPA: ABC transporter substrate-binding protein [Pseudonocardiaceae bacterium]|nr:ABC transporter substrate-binding protein [Pseudonocardiaceae bacterium]